MKKFLEARNVGRAALFCGAALLSFAAPAIVQAQPAASPAQAPAAGGRGGRGTRAPDQSLPLVQQAFKLSDPRYLISFSRYCMLDGPNTANGKGDAATPSQLFDNLYYVGRTDVGAWVLKTSAGLVLIDTLDNVDEAQNIVEAGMRKMGLDPSQLKLVILTHFHNDHSGGMPYFRAKGVPVMVSEADWGPLGGVPNPESVIHDGQVLKFGDTTISLYLIPGHTPGTIAAVFPVFDHGQRHMAMLTGGIGPQGTIEAHETSIKSLAHVADVARQAGVDVLLDPHEAIIDTTGWGYIMHPAERKAGQNDLIVGTDHFQKFVQMLSTCMKARVVMYQQKAAAAPNGAPR